MKTAEQLDLLAGCKNLSFVELDTMHVSGKPGPALGLETNPHGSSAMSITPSPRRGASSCRTGQPSFCGQMTDFRASAFPFYVHTGLS